MKILRIPQSYLFTKEGLRSVGYILLTVTALALFVALLLRPYAERAGKLRASIERLGKKAGQYEVFDQLSERIDGAKKHVIDVVDNSGLKVVASEGRKARFLDEIGRICEEAGIRPERIKPSEYKGKQVWSIGFTAGFPHLYSFLSTLERYYRVESIGIKSGEEKDEHDIDILIADLPVAGEEAPKTGETAQADFFDIFDAAVQKLQTIEDMRKMLVVGNGKLRDPMFVAGIVMPPPPKPKPVVKAAPRAEAPKKVEPPKISLGGIIWDPDNPVVIIDGQLVNEGQEIRGVTVVKIRQSSVVVGWQGERFTMKLR